jgi:hypothetical protein
VRRRLLLYGGSFRCTSAAQLIYDRGKYA